MEQTIEQITKLKVYLDEKFSEGYVSARYQRHVSHALRMLRCYETYYKSIEEDPSRFDPTDVSEILEKYCEMMLSFVIPLKKKIEREESEGELVLTEFTIEGLCTDIIRRSKLYDMEAMIVITSAESEKTPNVIVPCLLKLNNIRGNLVVEYEERAPLITVERSISEDILEWTLVAHEIGHLSDDITTYYGASSEDELRFMKELYCDLFASCITGPAYIYSMIEYSDVSKAFNASSLYLPFDHRIESSIDILKNSSDDIEWEQKKYMELLTKILNLWKSKIRENNIERPYYYEAILGAGKYLKNALYHFDRIQKLKDMRLFVGSWKNMHLEKDENLPPIELINKRVMSDFFQKDYLSNKEIHQKIVNWTRKQFAR